MKIINKIFRATKKDGSLEKVMAKLPDNSGGYSGIFTDLDQKIMDRVLKGLSECDEDMHPAMFIPLSYFFLKTPAIAKEDFDLNIGSETFLEKLIREFVDNVQEWIDLNEDLLTQLISLCRRARCVQINKDRRKIDGIYITPQIEEAFINNSDDNNLQRIKRIKILAAVNILLVYEPLIKAMNDNDAKLSAYYMFLFCRSMAQFSANRVVDMGLAKLKASRQGGGTESDRLGLKEFIEHFHAKFKDKTDKELWGIIKSDMNGKKFAKPHPGYSITFCEDYVYVDDFSGTLIQKNKEGVEYPIQYKAFTAIRGELRK